MLSDYTHHANPTLCTAVSPWFFTHFSTKNWVFICEDQPTLRWEQMLSLKPAIVEIVTWNGSSYPNLSPRRLEHLSNSLPQTLVKATTLGKHLL